jgi:dTDP-4-amino-4,6-dideoxygalactose transaminase
VLGPEVEAFEQEFARFLGAGHAVALNSGTDALVLGLAALGIGPGDEVITSPFTFFATAEAIVRVGAAPVFVDIEPGTLCLSPAACAAAITPRTKAVVVVHVFGHCGDLDALLDVCRTHNLILVEDACQAVGASWRGRMLGTVGSFGAFSFYPTKNLAALGDGGTIVTGDGTLAERVRALRHHGRNGSGTHAATGWNSRLDELQAAFLRRKLKSLQSDTARRRQLARRYSDELGPLVTVVTGREGCDSCWHQFAIRTPRRDALRQHLSAASIETGDYYPRPLYEEPALATFRPAAPLPEVERACREVLTLPIRPGLTGAAQEEVITAILNFAGTDD